MNILKLYHARWNQNAFDVHGKLYKDVIIQYFVLYERENHIKYQQTDGKKPFQTVIEHSDDIDNIILKELDKTFRQIQYITKFDSNVYEFRPWSNNEKFERARASKKAMGYDFHDLKVYSQTNNLLASLKTRVRFPEPTTIKNDIIHNLPTSIKIPVNENIPSLVKSTFYEKEEADRIIHDYWDKKY